MKRTLSSQIIVVVAFVATIVVNYLATSLPLAGKTTAELSDQYPVLVTPAGYVFSIWGLIYMGLLAFTVYQALPSQRDNARLEGLRLPFVLSSVANISWIFLWHYEWVTLSLGVMLLLLGTLIYMYRRARSIPNPTDGERWLVQRPISLYLGWITVATVVNSAVVLYNLGWNGDPLSPAPWAALMIAVAAGLGLWISRQWYDAVYGGVLVWAFIGIAIKHSDFALVVTAAALGIVVVIAGIVVALRSNGKMPVSARAVS